MDIPDEAWIAAHSVADADLDEVVRAVTPHIARSAQVAVLREMVARIHAAAPIAGSGGGMAVYRELAAVLSDEATKLEAGAGQAGAGNV